MGEYKVYKDSRNSPERKEQERSKKDESSNEIELLISELLQEKNRDVSLNRNGPVYD